MPHSGSGSRRGSGAATSSRSASGSPTRRHRSSRSSSDSPTRPTERVNGINFRIGARVDAQDFLLHWYPARVVDVDWSDRKALIHFERWNKRYDEWIPFNSPRLRPLISATSPERAIVERPPGQLGVGDIVAAVWHDEKYYPACVVGVEQELSGGSSKAVSYAIRFEDELRTVVTGIAVNDVLAGDEGRIAVTAMRSRRPPSHSSRVTAEGQVVDVKVAKRGPGRPSAETARLRKLAASVASAAATHMKKVHQDMDAAQEAAAQRLDRSKHATSETPSTGEQSGRRTPRSGRRGRPAVASSKQQTPGRTPRTRKQSTKSEAGDTPASSPAPSAAGRRGSASKSVASSNAVLPQQPDNKDATVVGTVKQEESEPDGSPLAHNADEDADTADDGSGTKAVFRSKRPSTSIYARARPRAQPHSQPGGLPSVVRTSSGTSSPVADIQGGQNERRTSTRQAAGTPPAAEKHPCPVEGCGKSFRKASGVSLHMRHAHKHLVSSSPSTPSPALPKKAGRKRPASPAPSQVKHVKTGRTRRRGASISSPAVAAPSSADSAAVSVQSPRPVSAPHRRKGEERQLLSAPSSGDLVEGQATTRCICGHTTESEFMIFCERCQTWQHGECVGITRKTVPADYGCVYCLKSRRGVDAQLRKSVWWNRLQRDVKPPLSDPPTRATSITRALANDFLQMQAAFSTAKTNINSLQRLEGSNNRRAVETLAGQMYLLEERIDAMMNDLDMLEEAMHRAQVPSKGNKDHSPVKTLKQLFQHYDRLEPLARLSQDQDQEDREEQGQTTTNASTPRDDS